MTGFPFGETVIHIVRAVAGEDRDGNDDRGDVETEVRDVGVAPRDGNGTSGNENVQGRDTVVVGLTLFLPAGWKVSATDRFRVRGELYEVDGQPEAFHHPFTGWNPGLPVSVKRVTG